MLADPLLTVGIPCGPGTADFARFLLQSIWKTVSDPRKVTVILAIAEHWNSAPFEAVAEDFGAVTIAVSHSGLPRIPIIRGSLAHGRSLQAIYEVIKTPHAVFCDVDTAYVLPSWDNTLTRYLKGNCIVIGSPYSNQPHRQMLLHDGAYSKPIFRYQGFPNVISFLFDVGTFRKINIDFLGLERLVTKKLARSYQDGQLLNEIMVTDDQSLLARNSVPPGAYWMLDTCFDLPIRIGNAGYTGYSLDHFFAGEGRILYGRATQSPECDPAGQQSEEYWIDGSPVVVHFAKGSRRSFNTPEAKIWCEQVEAWITSSQNN